MTIQAVILAGGRGTRLASRLDGRPKPLVDVDGIPLLERQITSLKQYGVIHFLVLVNYAADQIAGYCLANNNFGVQKLDLIHDGSPRGTAGAVLSCIDQLEDRFLVVYGDTLFNVDISRLLDHHQSASASATLLLHPNDHPYDSDLVTIDESGFVKAFHPKPHAPLSYLPNLVNAALYVVEREALEAWRNFPYPADFGADLFPAMLSAGQKLKGYNSFEYIKDIGTPERLDKAVKQLRSGVVARATLSTKQRCVFLDRDGTLNVLRGYVRAADELDLLPGAAEAVQALNAAEYRVVVVTNQPVVARGECSLDTLAYIHAKLDNLIAEEGGYIDRIYFCPHHPHSGFPGEVRSLKGPCECRKPAAGMIYQAQRELNIDLSASWFIGDSTSDVVAAQRAGVRAILVCTGEAGRDKKYHHSPVIIANDILSAARFIVDEFPKIVLCFMPLAENFIGNEIIELHAPSSSMTVFAIEALTEAMQTFEKLSSRTFSSPTFDFRDPNDVVLQTWVINESSDSTKKKELLNKKLIRIYIKEQHHLHMNKSFNLIRRLHAEKIDEIDNISDYDFTLEMPSLLFQENL